MKNYQEKSLSSYLLRTFYLLVFILSSCKTSKYANQESFPESFKSTCFIEKLILGINDYKDQRSTEIHGHIKIENNHSSSIDFKEDLHDYINNAYKIDEYFDLQFKQIRFDSIEFGYTSPQKWIIHGGETASVRFVLSTKTNTSLLAEWSKLKNKKFMPWYTLSDKRSFNCKIDLTNVKFISYEGDVLSCKKGKSNYLILPKGLLSSVEDSVVIDDLKKQFDIDSLVSTFCN